MKGAVVLLSGGLDSSVLLHWVRRELGVGADLRALSFDYGQRHAYELEMARLQAKRAAVREHRIVPFRFFSEMILGASVLTDAGMSIPDGRSLSEFERNQPPTYVPNRNMILLSLAAAFAEATRLPLICYGAHRQDAYGYWDCTADFVQALNAVLAQNRRDPVKIWAPFVEWDKTAIIRAGVELGVDFAATWSCYRGSIPPACGVCSTCLERRRAFEKAGITDPLGTALN